jgi:polyhydroxyalkanoate synthesis regulator phasin
MSEKEASQVLTSDNAAEFYANRLGLAESPAESVAEESSEPEAVVEQSEPEEAEAEAKQEGERKQNPKLERRFSEITKQREEARKEAQQEREARQALEARLAALENKGQPQKANPVDEKPQPSQFSDAFEYAEALAEYTADQRIANMKREEAEAKQAEERQKVISQWTSKVEAAKASLPDFDDIVASSDVVVNDDIRDAILESDVGPQILYHLAENDEIAKKIAGLSPKAALREIGKLEARFEAKPEAEKPAPIVRSKAPAPIQPIRGGKNTPDVPIGSDGVFFGTAAQWKELRRAGKIR